MAEIKEKLSREEIDNIRADFKDDEEMGLLCDMAVMALRFYNRGGPYKIDYRTDGKVFLNGQGHFIPWDEVESMLNDRDSTLQQFQDCCKAVRRAASDPVSLAEYLNSSWGRNPGRSILRELIAGNISVGKMGELMELKVSELHELKMKCGAFNEQEEGAQDTIKMFLKGDIGLAKMMRMFGLGQDEADKMIRRCQSEMKLNA